MLSELATPAAPFKTWNRSGANRPPTNPTIPAVRTMRGNGTPKKKMATKETVAITYIVGFFKTRFPMRSTASNTIASTAGFRPKNNACTATVCWYSA